MLLTLTVTTFEISIVAGRKMIYYTLNTIPGVRLSDESLKSICMPRLELGGHITMRVSEVFTVLGVGLVGPLVAVAKGNRDLKGIEESAFTSGKYGFMSGLAVGSVLSGAFMRNKTKDSIVDRCYRLRCNKKNVRIDQLTILGTLTGVGIAYHLGNALEKGAVFGLAGSVILSGVLNAML